MMLWIWIVLQVILAVVYGNLLEYLVHRYVLHGLGSKKILFDSHWHRHHRYVRRHHFYDNDYKGWSWGWNSRTSEIAGLAGLALLHSPLLLVAPVLFGGLVAWAVLYYVVHSTSHRYPKLGARYFPWHYDHHMALDQNLNWAVTFPLWDYILGTRKTTEEQYAERKKIRLERDSK